MYLLFLFLDFFILPFGVIWLLLPLLYPYGEDDPIPVDETDNGVYCWFELVLESDGLLFVGQILLLIKMLDNGWKCGDKVEWLLELAWLVWLLVEFWLLYVYLSLSLNILLLLLMLSLLLLL